MAAKRTYSSATKELDKIISDLESKAISIDDLSKKVSEAKELIKWCKEKLRTTEEGLTSED